MAKLKRKARKLLFQYSVIIYREKGYDEKGSAGASGAQLMSYFLTWGVKLFVYALCTFLRCVLFPQSNNNVKGNKHVERDGWRQRGYQLCPLALEEAPLLFPPTPTVDRTYASPRKRLGQTSLMWLSTAARRTHSKRCSEASVGGW